MTVIPEIKSYLKYQKQRFKKTPRYLLTRRVIAFLEKPTALIPLSEIECNQMLRFLRNHLIEVFNYPFVARYLYRRVKVRLDKETGLHYVLTAEYRRLYFKRGMSACAIRSLYNSLCLEQDGASPHHYNFAGLSFSPTTTVVADIGAAEGIFSLKFIENIKKAYLFETNQDWIEALEATFRPWNEKIEIINKYVSNKDEQVCVSLDTFFRDRESPTLLKIDVEGAEDKVIQGAERLLASDVHDALVCTYHRSGDELKLTQQLRAKGYDTIPSPGYMLFFWEKPDYSMVAPFDFRKGLIYAFRKK